MILRITRCGLRVKKMNPSCLEPVTRNPKHATASTIPHVILSPERDTFFNRYDKKYSVPSYIEITLCLPPPVDEQHQQAGRA